MNGNPSTKDRTLEARGFSRCTFDFDGEEECLSCDRIPAAGAPQYWQGSSYEYPDEGDYYCRRCAYDRALDRYYDITAAWRKHRPMHGAGWAYLHGMADWEMIFYRGLADG